MQNYHVVWEIDVEAENPGEAAQQAFDCMYADTLATVFIVTDEIGKEYQVDLKD